MNDADAGDPLAFSEAKQCALLGHAIHDRLFFLQVRAYLEPNWFSSVGNQKFWSLLERFYETSGRFPQSTKELTDSKEMFSEDQANRNMLMKAFHTCVDYMGQFGQDLLIKEFSLWARSLLLEEFSMKAAAAFNQKRPEDALDIFKQGYQNIIRAELVNADAETWDIDQFVKESKSEIENGLTFGCPQLDQKLNASAPDGALLRGDTTVILAPSNVGKTTALVTVAAHNIVRGKNVLFLSHEGRPQDIKGKIRRCILQVTEQEMFALMAASDWWRQYARYWDRIISQHLTYLPMNKAFLSVKEVEATVRRLQELRKLSDPRGRGYDMLVDDYPALLVTDGLMKGQLQKRISDEQVYGCFVSMALEYGFHCLLAIQTNREGSKVNRGQGSMRLLSMEDVQESFGVMQKATNVITMNRSPYDKTRNRVTFYLCKSRSSDTDWAFTCRSDYSRATTHAPQGWPENNPGRTFPFGVERAPDVNMEKYGCTAYSGSEMTTTAQLDALIDQYREGEAIPGDVLDAAVRGVITGGMKGTGHK